MTLLNQILRFLAIALAVLALASGVVLLAKDAGATVLVGLPTSVISSAPLLLVGVAFLLAQPLMRPSKMELVKNALLAATFLLWGAVQLMPPNALAARLGDLVVVLYVVDLAWAILVVPRGSERPPRGFD